MSSQSTRDLGKFMNVTLSKRGDYVMRAAICLARAYENSEPVKIRQVSSLTDIPVTYTAQVLSDLVRSGLAVSRAGRSGGYWLARSPDQISVLDVIEAGEGEIHSDMCAMGNGPCRWEQVCPMHESWRGALAAFRTGLKGSSLAQVAERDRQLEQGIYKVPADSHRAAHHLVDYVAE